MLPTVIRPQNHALAQQFVKEGNLPPVLAQCLASRGVQSTEIALLRHKLLPYKHLRGIKELAQGLAHAIINKEKMVVVADYDCDGATACAIAVSGLEALGAIVDFVVPDRLVHGYGLTPSVVDVAKEKNPKHIVTVDNGIASIEGVHYAESQGIKVWVTDHHLPGATLPNASGIVNPNQPFCPFPSKNLAGCGVMFYVLAATNKALKDLGVQTDIILDDWLDLVSLGTVADVVKLDDNNRWLVNQGLIRIRQGFMRPGLHALFDISNKNFERATSGDFGFALGPRLNAAGRLSDMSIGIKCLLAQSYEEGYELAKELCVLNEDRKDLENQMKEYAWNVLDLENQSSRFTRVVFGQDFHEGVIGIVAGRIKEKEFAPTIVFAQANNDPGVWKGSGRSIPGLHLRDALDLIYKKNPHWFLKFGGHAMAAGLGITDEARPLFAQAFEDVVKELLDNKKPQQELLVDGPLDPTNITIETAKALQEFVWGQGFEEPTWVGEFEVKEVVMMGREKNHLKMIVSPLNSNQKFCAMHFFQEEDSVPSEGQVIQMAYRLQCSVFRDEEKLDLIVVDR